MIARIETLVQPASEPITLAEAKLHLRVDHAADDALIDGLIAAARQAAEHRTGRALMTQTVRQTCDARVFIHLRRLPVQSITSATIDGVLIDSALYDEALGEYAYLDMQSAPSGTKAVIEFVAGYGDAPANVPAALRQWMYLQIGAMYANREAVSAQTMLEMPFVDGLLDPYKTFF